jgi:methionyl-tRNA formyltransferase
MRIVFLGASELGYNCCEAILKAGHNVVGILTLGTEFSIKYRELKERTNVKNYLFKDFRDFETQYNIPVRIASQPVSEQYQLIEEWKPDLIVVIGWYYMIPKNIMELPNKGVIGIHASLLPKYRGNAPLVWAMINGEKETGISLFYIGDGVDEGDVIEQKSFSIEESDYIASVLKKTEVASIEVLIRNLPLLASGNAPKIKQDHSIATYFPKRNPEDGQINWEWEPSKIKNFIRAQSKPYPGAFTIINGKKIILWDADISYLMEDNETN